MAKVACSLQGGAVEAYFGHGPCLLLGSLSEFLPGFTLVGLAPQITESVDSS